jgi:hypothetical protein
MRATNYFEALPENPYQLSVAALVLNKKGQIACHHFPYSDYYILMRETVNPNETLEHALSRGLMAEMGIRASLVTYLGGLENTYFKYNEVIEKTTLYFLCRLQSFDVQLRDCNDKECDSTIEWQTFDFLIPQMKEQANRLGRETIDESKALEKARIYLAQQ